MAGVSQNAAIRRAFECVSPVSQTGIPCGTAVRVTADGDTLTASHVAQEGTQFRENLTVFGESFVFRASSQLDDTLLGKGKAGAYLDILNHAEIAVGKDIVMIGFPKAVEVEMAVSADRHTICKGIVSQLSDDGALAIGDFSGGMPNSSGAAAICEVKLAGIYAGLVSASPADYLKPRAVPLDTAQNIKIDYDASNLTPPEEPLTQPPIRSFKMAAEAVGEARYTAQNPGHFGAFVSAGRVVKIMRAANLLGEAALQAATAEPVKSGRVQQPPY